MQQFLIPAKHDLHKARADWLKTLSRERRLSPLTVVRLMLRHRAQQT